MIGPSLVLWIHQTPGIQVRIPDLRIVDREGVIELEAVRVAPDRQNVAVRQDDFIEKLPGQVHRGGRRKDGTGTIEVDGVGVRGRGVVRLTGRPAGNQDKTLVIEHRDALVREPAEIVWTEIRQRSKATRSPERVELGHVGRGAVMKYGSVGMQL